MAHLGRPGHCVLCGDELELAPTELAVLEGYELAMTNVTRTDDDDLEDAEEDYKEVDPSELYGTFCDSCAPKIKIDIERACMRRVDAAAKVREKLGGDDASRD
jgi:hypothetical protein